MNPEIVGGIAAILTTAAYVPQFIKVFREKNTKGLSLGMYILITSGLAVWLIYGLMIDSPSVIIANAVTLLLAAGILFMKIKHG
ncbi:MAG: SemiSWEET transporter [Rickettsiales bacterium]